MSKYDFYRDKMLDLADRGDVYPFWGWLTCSLVDPAVSLKECVQLHEMGSELINAVLHGTGPCGKEPANEPT